MAVLLTGNLGFIGSHFCEKLLLTNEEVIGLDNLDPYYNPKYKKQNREILEKYKSLTQIIGDYNDRSLLKLIFTNYEIEKVVHIGARAGVRTSIELAYEYTENNVLGTINLLEMTRKHSVDNFIFASSSSVYGESETIPFKEIDSADRPESPYAASKRSCELYGHTYHSLYGINFTAFRFFTVYGPRGRPDMAIYKFTKSITEEKEVPVYGDGSYLRDYTYISDIIDGIFLGLKKNSGYDIYNLGNEKPISVLELVNKIENITNMKAKIKFVKQPKGDVKQTFADISKAKRILGYEPKINLTTGLEKFIDWYTRNKEKL